MPSQHVVTVKVMERTYNIKCSAEQSQSLYQAANYFEEQMKKVRQSGHVTNTDNIAVVAALNICHDLLSLQAEQTDESQQADKKLFEISSLIENALAKKEETTV